MISSINKSIILLAGTFGSICVFSICVIGLNQKRIKYNKYDMTSPFEIFNLTLCGFTGIVVALTIRTTLNILMDKKDI